MSLRRLCKIAEMSKCPLRLHLQHCRNVTRNIAEILHNVSCKISAMLQVGYGMSRWGCCNVFGFISNITGTGKIN